VSSTYLPPGLPAPVPSRDGLDGPYWEAASQHRLVAQRCAVCARWQWGPEWLCHRCQSFDVSFVEPPGPARIFSWERSWHPVHPVLADHGPYVVVLVEFPQADGIRMVGNLLGDPTQEVTIGAEVEPHFEDHDHDPPFTLVHWRLV
jgi:uncharacterized protein